MKPEEIGALLGDISRGDEVLKSLHADAGPAVSKAIRKSFTRGDEQGNARRLHAVVTIEGEGALDLLEAVLLEKEEVGGLYSNLRNTALPIMLAVFPGHPKLEKALWRAVELDEYLDVDTLYAVTAAYDPKRALELLVPHAERGVPAALRTLAALPEGLPKVVKLLEAAIKKGQPDRFIEALGPTALKPELSALIIPLADSVPAAAELASRSDPARARATAELLSSKDARQRAVAVKALALLPAAEIFERVSPLFTATKPAARAQLELVLWSPVRFEDERWLPFLQKRLEAEEQKKTRYHLLRALALLRPVQVEAVASAPKDDSDTVLLKELPLVLGQLKIALASEGKWEQERAAFVAALRDAAGRASPKHKKKLEASIKALDR